MRNFQSHGNPTCFFSASSCNALPLSLPQAEDPQIEEFQEGYQSTLPASDKATSQMARFFTSLPKDSRNPLRTLVEFQTLEELVLLCSFVACWCSLQDSMHRIVVLVALMFKSLHTRRPHSYHEQGSKVGPKRRPFHLLASVLRGLVSFICSGIVAFSSFEPYWDSTQYAEIQEIRLRDS